jgi:hypothetical protein
MSLSWSEVWFAALTRPSVRSYEALSSQALAMKPGMASRRAYRWILISSFVAGLLGTQVILMGEEFDPSMSFFVYCTGPIFTALFYLLGFAVFVTVTQLIARALGGIGIYPQLAFTTAAFYASIILIQSVSALLVSIIPGLALLITTALTMYTSLLTVIAVRAVHQFGWVKAIASASLVLAVQFCIIMLPAFGLLQ